ncbi:MAG: type II toxin-antitoxin system RelE/ParE family toxin [Nanoarchaeota archaeon]|nr:type II toxin-antitoxin system RelE/ParE family toxin [Nanoarchaeota archaeon]
MRKFLVEKKLERILIKLERKNKELYGQVKKKIGEVLTNPDIDHYKNLRYDLKEYKRVHVGSFVLVFKYDKQKDFVYFDDFDHHDKIYG